MGYRMDLKDADRMFAKLQEEYEIWAQNVLWVRAGIPTQT